MLIVYEYKGCSTCKKALKFLAENNVNFESRPIRERPPTKSELTKMLQFVEGDLRKLFNTSGQDYRAMNLKEKLPELSKTQAFDLLSKNGNLVKRPFVIGKNFGVVGFNEDTWKKLINKF